MPADRSLAVLLNPVAGSRRAGRMRDRLRAALDASGTRYALIPTERPRHAADLAREAAQAFDAVIAAGGDGTAQEAACGLLDSGTGTPLGIIPLGTGNDLAEQIGMPRRPEAALAAVLAAEPVAVDVGRVRWREEDGGAWQEGLFLNAVGVGFDALAAAEAARFKRFRGKSAYLAGILRALVRWPQPTVTVERLGPSSRILPDGSTTPADPGDLLHRGPLFLAAAGNGRSVGGGFRLTPYASLVDGLLDLSFVADVRPWRLPVLIPQVIRGRHLGAPEVVAERLPGLRLRSPNLGVPFHLDGEVLSTRAVEIEARLSPGALRLLCPTPACGPLLTLIESAAPPRGAQALL